MRPQGVGLLTALIVLAAVAFGIGAGLEKASRTGSPVVHREAAGGIEPGASSESAVPGSEVVLAQKVRRATTVRMTKSPAPMASGRASQM